MNDIKKEKPKMLELKVCLIFVFIIFAVFITARYATDESFRNDFDKYILKKEVTDSKIASIEINSDTNPYIFAHDKYIDVLSKNTITEYLSDGSVYGKIDVNISVPLYASNDKYLALADKNGQKLYLISGSNVIWQKSLDGNISQISVNKNGYVSIILKNTTYKSVIVAFSADGTELFRRYLSANYAICSDISNNNKYLAIGEVDYSGTLIKSYVNILSISLAQTDPENSILNTYESKSGEIITNIDYKDKDSAYCMFNSYIQKVTDNSDETVYEITNNDLFLDLNLKNNYAILDKQSSGLFSYEYEINIKNSDTKADNLYILKNEVPKTMVTGESIIALNFGNEVEIINTNGWLLKKYTSGTEIKNIVVGNTIAGIIYKNKIDVIGL